MPFFKQCEACVTKIPRDLRRKLYVSKRLYKTKVAGVIESHSELCGKCYKEISKML